MFEAKWNGQQVAAKELHLNHRVDERMSFMEEADTMRRFDHPNIVRLLAVSFEAQPMQVLMEHMTLGDLASYLRSRRGLVNEQRRPGEESEVSATRLTGFVQDVARGLAYLAEQKTVHRDLACRNCLLTASLAENQRPVVKLGDFGLARYLEKASFTNKLYYRLNNAPARLPTPHMAPESLRDDVRLFTPASDVWSFGIVIWEVITFGGQPFEGMGFKQMLEYIRAGNSLGIPVEAKPHLAGLLLNCWQIDSSKRPTASSIVEFINKFPDLVTPCLNYTNVLPLHVANNRDLDGYAELNVLNSIDTSTININMSEMRNDS